MAANRHFLSQMLNGQFVVMVLRVIGHVSKKMHVEFEHKSGINVIEFEAHVLKFKGQNAQFGNILVPKLAFCSFGKATS